MFENAKFGDRFVLRNGIKAIYVEKREGSHMIMWVEDGDLYEEPYNDDGTDKHETEYDVVSKFDEDINDDHVYDLARAYYKQLEDDFEYPVDYRNIALYRSVDSIDDILDEDSIYDAFYAGYVAAKKE